MYTFFGMCTSYLYLTVVLIRYYNGSGPVNLPFPHISGGRQTAHCREYESALILQRLEERHHCLHQAREHVLYDENTPALVYRVQDGGRFRTLHNYTSFLVQDTPNHSVSYEYLL